MAETPRFAHLMVLLLLGAGLGTAAGLFAILYGTLGSKGLLPRLGIWSLVLCGGGYVAVLLAASVFSGDKTLPQGSWKYFCEPDCHIAYSITTVQQRATLGAESTPVSASGIFVVVRLRTLFDANTISKHRGNSPLTPVPRMVSIKDASGRTFRPMVRSAALLDLPSTPLTQPLRPGESYATTFVFDLPRDASDLRFLIADDDPVSVVTIGHENSPLHGKIYFSLEPSPAAAHLSIR